MPVKRYVNVIVFDSTITVVYGEHVSVLLFNLHRCW
jgi:hypothetical protein